MPPPPRIFRAFSRFFFAAPEYEHVVRYLSRLVRTSSGAAPGHGQARVHVTAEGSEDRAHLY